MLGVASGSLPAILKIHKLYVRGAELRKQEMYRDSDKEPQDAHTEDLYDALISYPHNEGKLAQEDERGFDQTAKADKGKIRPTLVPRQIIRDIAVVREYGNRKYHDPDNWKEVEVERYRDALCRHLLAYLDDPKSVDEESGIPHYKHMACNMAFICEMENWTNGKEV